MTSQPGKQTIVIHILTNIARTKGNQTMKFAQLTEYNIRNIFLEKSYTKWGGETIPRPFSKNSKLSISRDQFSIVCIGYQKIWKLSSRPPIFTSYKAFLEHKKRSGTSLPA